MLPIPLSQILDPSLLGLGRLPARATLTPCMDEASARSGHTKWRQSLDGDWRFQLVDRPAQAPQAWEIEDASQAPWRDIKVPGVWTRQDTGDLPHYANWHMPFACAKPPEIPQDNTTGLYRKILQVPSDWIARKTILHIGGFESLAMVWCNGLFIGLAKDSRLPSEFDLSDAVHEGDNLLAIMVLRWCDATWIEDQDHWNHAGLHRSVWVESRAQTHVQDLVIDTDFDPEQETGSAAIKVAIDGPSEGYYVVARLEDANGNAVVQPQSAPVAQFDTSRSMASQWKQSFTFAGYAASLSLVLPHAQPWSAETPTRYRLITTLMAPDGATVEIHQTWIGFTRIEATGRRLKVNGQPIVLIGVNRHDHHPENGKTCSEAETRAELLTMKRHNINAIRTAHYPNDPVLLDLADELGFYVIDEANVECHARWTEVAQHPGYHAAIVERTTRMIARDRNHPCIISWSLGNEAGLGPAHTAAAAAARQLDPGRFVHYEGAVAMRFSFPFGRGAETMHQAPAVSERATTDVVCPMYSSIEDIVNWARWAEATQGDDRPLVLCEFSHAMGNSNGSLAAYVDAFFDEPALAGGFVWDWRDQGLTAEDAQGRFYWAYGGHFGDTPNDANFNINGLVGPDGVPHPALREYAWAARPVKSEWLGASEVRCLNRRVFSDTRDLVLTWEVLLDGVCVERGRESPILEPGESTTLTLPIQSDLSGQGMRHLSLVWRQAQETPWAGVEHVVAWDQFELAATPSAPRVGPVAADLLRIENGEVWRGDAPLLASAITPCLWRAPTDNDGGKPGTRPLFQSKTNDWVGYGLDALEPGERNLAETDYGAKATQSWCGRDGQALQHESLWTLYDGHVRIDETLIIPEAWQDLPRIGVRFEIAPTLTHVEWLGLGPDESYPDRSGAQMIGVWRSLIADQYHPYVRPQEYGAHEQCRWFSVMDTFGNGFRVTLPSPLSVTVRPHHDADLNAAETLAELITRNTSEVHIDVAMRGLGTGACGPDALPQYLVGPGLYKFSWIISPLQVASAG